MSFGSRLQRALVLTRQCWQLLRENKVLLVLPALSGVLLVVVLASFALPFIVSTGFRETMTADTPETETLDYVYGFFFYLLVYTGINFFNAALIFCILARLRGEDGSIGAGLALAARRFPLILAWSLVSATVGLVLNVLRDRAGPLGSIVSGLAGLAWSVATYFVLPVLVVEGVGPFRAIQRSTSILRRVWGESLAANFGLGIVTVLAVLPVFALMGLAFATLPGGAAAAVLAIGVVVIIAVVLVVNTLSAILQVAIYEYADSGKIVGPFGQSQLAGAFVHRG